MSVDNAIKPTLKDPVCGMTVMNQSPNVFNYKGKPVYFCSASCKAKSAGEPAKYLVANSSSSATVLESSPIPTDPIPTGTIYTGPMHPEVRQDHAGACPKCGMALEPEMPSLEDGESPELVDFKRRFTWTLPLTVIVTFLAMLGHRLQWFEMVTQSWIELVLSLPIVLWAGHSLNVVFSQLLIATRICGH